MLLTQSVTIEVPIPFPGYSIGIGLPPNLHMVSMQEGDVLRCKRAVERVEVQGGVESRLLLQGCRHPMLLECLPHVMIKPESVK